ncbi:peptidase C40 [Pasteurellaceae bacterium LFhippo2]|nr:peptidase C40 [Pasteurellaceae bacterium LFhippo2]
MKQLFSRLSKPLFVIFAAAFLSACSSTADASLSTKAATPSQVSKYAQKESGVKTSSLGGRNAADKVLSVYRNWAGVRYRLGGSTKAGIDCSAFVQKVMGSFNVNMPRSTTEQKTVGRKISKSELRPGDLVFFRGNKHVGVYVGNGQFVHAGSSTGVTKASLSNSYWARTYTQSRRVL